MNYKEINEAILNDRDVDENLVTKDEKFYKYLFNNKVAYYYSKYLSKRSTEKEKWIIKRGDELNQKYYSTLKKLKDICDTNSIDFLLYKTHKYIPEVVDGDIDLFVHESDFKKFMSVFEKDGFQCIEDEPGKGKCTMDGYLVIEPHSNISWRGGNYTTEDFIWNNPVYIESTNYYSNVKSASFDVEFVSLVGKVFFEPSYLDLQNIKQIKIMRGQIDFNKICRHINFSDGVKIVISILKNDPKYINKKLPLFLTNSVYISIWTKRGFSLRNVKIYFLHIVYFLYWKYRYIGISKLPFSHQWHEK